MMKLLLSLALLLGFYQSASCQSEWLVGPRAGLVTAPYLRGGASATGGGYIGVELRGEYRGGSVLSFTTDYRKVSNLGLSRLERTLSILPSGTAETISLSGINNYAAFSLGLRYCPRQLTLGKFRLGLAANLDYLAPVVVSTRNTNNTIIYQYYLAETFRALIQSGGNGSGSGSQTTGDRWRNVFTAGFFFDYVIANGPCLTLGWHFDLNDRFTMFAGTNKARLHQVRLGFSYPFVRF